MNGKCIKCNSDSKKNVGGSEYCAKHFRFSQMRHTAKHRGKSIPSFEQLEIMLIENGMICPGCGNEMNWLNPDDSKLRISLQHDCSGEIRFLCFSCNCRHSKRPGDSFYTDPKDKRRCGKCHLWKDFSEFWKGTRYLGLQNECKSCRSERHKSWHSRNREKNILSMRIRYAKMRDLYNANRQMKRSTK